MGFHGLLIGVVLVTLLAIFSVYRIFLYHPAQSQYPTPSALIQQKPSITPSTAPSQTPKPTSSPSPKSLISIKTMTPAQTGQTSDVTVLQNNINPTSGSSNISGSLYINGTPPSGSSVVIVEQPQGSNQSQVVISGLNPSTGTNFNWTGANKGTTYDMVAVLKQNINGTITDIAKSQTYTLTAPTQNFQFTINVGYALAAPTGNITVTCNTHYSNNTWYATVNFPQVNSAQSYFFQIGSTSGGTDLVNIASIDNTQNVTINDSQAYYAQYSAASVSNPTPYQYSPYSSSQIIRCP